MSWQFVQVALNRVFVASLATPPPGAEETFEVSGFECDDPNLVRGYGISIQLAGESSVEYLDRSQPMRGSYSGFADLNAFSKVKGLLPPGVCRSTAGEGLEYLCLLPSRPKAVLDYELVTAPVALLQPADESRLVLALDAGLTFDGRPLPRFGAAPLPGALTGEGRAVVVWASRPPRARPVPAVPERIPKATAARIGSAVATERHDGKKDPKR